MARNTTQADDPHFGEGYIYALVALSVLTGVVLATHRMAIDVQLLGFLLPLVVAITIGGPVVMGYNGNSFLAGMVIGVLPPAGAFTSIFAWSPFDVNVIESMVAAAFRGTALTLPVVSILFVIGVALRRDGTLVDRNRELALRVVFGIIFSVAILWSLDIGLLETYGDQ